MSEPPKEASPDDRASEDLALTPLRPAPPAPHGLLTPTAPNVPAPTLATDLPCVRCGYNLRGLPRNSRCPECGTPIAHTQRGDRLELASPAWLATLRNGAWALTGGLALLGLSLVSGTLWWIGAIADMVFVDQASPGQLTLHLVPAAGLILHALGTWWSTTPEPLTAEAAATRCLRRLARYTGCAGACLVLVFLLMTHAASPRFAPPAWLLILSDWGLPPLIAGLALLTLQSATLPHLLRSLARRLPDDVLAYHLQTLAGILVLALLGLTAVAISPWIQLFCMWPVVATAAAVPCYLWSLYVCLRLANNLRHAAKTAGPPLPPAGHPPHHGTYLS